MTDLSKRMRELHAHKNDKDDGPPIDIGCGVAGRDFYKACDESVPALCAEIEALETELAYERDARRFKVFELIPGDWVWTESDGCINGAWPTMRAAVDAARKAGAK